uniref:GTP-binding protein n=1 Tax=Setaria digitata TaxID=48799 RepID=A0A915PL96_9BILA
MLPWYQQKLTLSYFQFRAVRAGKSTIIKILTGKYNFTNKDYEMTQGVELYDKTLESYGHTMDVVLVDTAGHQLYKWLLNSICDENAFYALCFDFTNKDSLGVLQAHFEQLKIKKSVLIGCKYDLQSRHTISLADAEEFATNNNLKLHLTSAVAFVTNFKLFPLRVYFYRCTPKSIRRS